MIDKSDIVRTYGRSLPERVLARIAPDETGCWLWQGTIVKPGGYPKFSGVYAHRFTYTTLIGAIPDNHELDHLCRVRHCVNPHHLEAVTHFVNVSRAPFMNLSACKWGHDFTPDNTAIRVRADGATYRQCRTCVRIRSTRAVRECALTTKESAPAGTEALSQTNEGVS